MVGASSSTTVTVWVQVVKLPESSVAFQVTVVVPFGKAAGTSLVIATDVSRSINDEEADIQREGMAEAFQSPEVIKAIESGALGRIAVAMLDWSSPEFNRVVLDWTIIDGKQSAEAFANQVRNAPRTPGRRTSISGAIEMGALMLEASEKNIIAT